MNRILTNFVISGILGCSTVNAESEGKKALSEAESRFSAARNKSQLDYRRDLAEVIGKGDRIEVYLLSFNVQDTPADGTFEADEFPILPYRGKTKILKRAILTANQRNDFLPVLQKVVGIRAENGGAGCHFPIHGVRIFSGDEILFQTSFCWHCNNFFILYPNPDGPVWSGIRGGELSGAFSRLMPVPQSELDRFNATFLKKRAEVETKAEQAAP